MLNKKCSYCGCEVDYNENKCPSCGSSKFINKSILNFSPSDDEDASSKSKLVAGVAQLLFGGLGIGRFYTGYTSIAVAQIIVTTLTCGIGGLWGFIDGILILSNKDFKDAEGKKCY